MGEIHEGELRRRRENFWEHFFGIFCLDFKKIDFREFLRFLHGFWCKMKLKIYILQIKSFLPPSLVFYLLLLPLKHSFLKKRLKVVKNGQNRVDFKILLVF